MKFTDGYWQMRDGYTPHFAAQAYDVEANGQSLTVYAPTKRIGHRGDTLNLPMLTVRYSSPMDGVIRVQVTHLKGGKRPQPQFQIFEGPASPKVTINETMAELASGELKVQVQRCDAWDITFRAGEQILTGSGWRALGFVDTPDGRFIHEQLNLGVGEYVYGLGERFTPFISSESIASKIKY